MLRFICDESAIPLDNKLITQSSLLNEINEEVLHITSIGDLKQYFTADAWMAVTQRGNTQTRTIQNYIFIFPFSELAPRGLEVSSMSTYHSQVEHDCMRYL